MKFDVKMVLSTKISRETLAPRLRLQVLWVVEGTPSSGHLSALKKWSGATPCFLKGKEVI